MNGLAVVLGLAAATCFALSSAIHQRAAKQETPRVALDPRLLFRLLHRPLWLFGWIPDGAGTALQALALRFGPLALVQSVLVSGLFLAIPLEAALNRSRPHPRDLFAVGVGVIGLAAFLGAAEPTAGVSDPSKRAWAGVGLGSGVAVAACLVLAGRSTAAARGTLLGVATGILYALIAALIKPLATVITAHPLAVLTNFHLYALIAVGIAGLQLNQNAFQSGRLAAPLTAVTLVDPVASTIIAVTAFHETLAVDAPRLVIEVVSVALMAAGMWLVGTNGRTGTS
ncbi:MAG TPA: DMT family transporter [Micromonosporaceae bacterium]